MRKQSVSNHSCSLDKKGKKERIMKNLKFRVCSLIAFLFMGVTLVYAQEVDAATLLRVYNPNSGEHHYTENTNERNHLVKVGWRNEGISWETPSSGKAVYRVYNPNSGDHHYTVDINEKNHLVKVGWRYEGVGWQSGGTIPVYRLYNPNAKTGTHHYTLHAYEKDHLVKVGWRYEGIGFYSTKGQSSNNGSNQGVPPRKVDVNITGAGGVEQAVTGSYRLLYSNKVFDQATLNGNATIDFSADIAMSGNKNDYETQFVIAGNGKACGQVGIGLHYQAGSDVNFAQGRINTTNINFPAGSGVYGQQYYSVNTNAPRIVNNQLVHLRVKYYSTGYMQTFVNNTLVGQYKTSLLAGDGVYILHDTTNTPVKIRNLKVIKNGVDVTTKGRPSFSSTSFDFSSGSVSGAY